jgi:hypothetical protein
MIEKQIVKEFIDKDTGEIISLYEGDKFRITRGEQVEAIEKSLNTKILNQEIKEWNDELGGFVFVLFKYSDDILRQHFEITSEDITKLFYLATYVDYKGYLIYNDTYMTKNDMKTILQLSRNPFDLFFNKMKRLDIFIIDSKIIKINKEYFAKGEIDKEIKQYYDYTRVYIKTIRYLFENTPQRKHKQLGNYFKLIPYIHRQQNVLSWNPESNKADMQLMTLKDLREILGYHRNSVKGFINELLSTKLESGESILGFFVSDVDFWKSIIIVNPKVFYGGNFDLPEGKNSIIKWFSK